MRMYDLETINKIRESIEPPKPKRNPYVIGCVILFGLLCMFCGGLAWIAEGADQALSTPVKEWLAQRWLDSTYDKVFEITDDEMLIELREPEVSIGGTMVCVGAGAAQVFGTDRPYDDVIEDFTSWAQDNDWEIVALTDEGFLRVRIPNNVYSMWFDSVRSFYVRPYEPEEPVDFETVYELRLGFVESRCSW